MTQHYTFGHTDRAALRLDLLADVYEPSSRSVLARHSMGQPGLAVDLGSGIGRTTRLLHDTCRATRTVGLEMSPRFLEIAREAHGSVAIEFLEHDVTGAPFPVGPADLLYSRFLLTHLADPTSVLRTWLEVSAPSALLICEEVAKLESEHPTLARYYELVKAMQAHYGQSLYIGQDLVHFVSAAEWQVIDARVAELELPIPTMAELHCMNIATWKQDPFAQSHFDPEEVSALEIGLGKLARSPAAGGAVVCNMAEVVAKRRQTAS